MYNYASLVATEHILREAIDSPIVFEEYVEKERPLIKGRSLIKISFRNPDSYWLFNEDRLPWPLVQRICFYEKHKVIIEGLLERQPTSGFNEALAVCLAEYQIEQFIDRESFRSGYVNFDFLGKPYKIKVDPSKPYFDRGKLSLAKALISGYKFVEEMGCHFWVIPFKEKGHVATSHRCDCLNFRLRRDCLHRQLVETIVQNRQLVRGVVTIV